MNVHEEEGQALPLALGFLIFVGLVVGACAPLIGAFLVQKRMSLMGDGIGHIAFAGVAVGLLTGVWPIWTALRSSGRSQRPSGVCV